MKLLFGTSKDIVFVKNSHYKILSRNIQIISIGKIFFKKIFKQFQYFFDR